MKRFAPLCKYYNYNSHIQSIKLYMTSMEKSGTKFTYGFSTKRFNP